MKRLITFATLIILVFSLSGCLFGNPYKGEVKLYKHENIESIAYKYLPFTDLIIFEDNEREFEIKSGGISTYSIRYLSDTYSIYQNATDDYIGIKDFEDNEIIEFDPYQKFLDYIDSAGNVQYTQIDKTNVFKYNSDLLTIEVSVDSNMKIKTGKIINRASSIVLLEIFDINKVEVTIPAHIKMSAPSFVMKRYPNVSYSFLNDIFRTATADYTYTYDFELNVEKIYINSKFYIYSNDPEVFTNVITEDILTIDQLLMTEPSITGSQLAFILELSNALKNYDVFFPLE